MARPTKRTVDYFPHYCHHKKTMYIIENKYGNDGYAFWFKILELLSVNENHVYDCNNPADWEFLLAKTRVSEVSAYDILNTLSNLDAIDPKLWEKRLIWSDNFVSGIADVYRRRGGLLPQKPSLCQQKPRTASVSDDKNLQSKVKKTKLEYIQKTKEVLSYLNEKLGKNFKSTDQILARLQNGGSVEQCKKIIDTKSCDPFFQKNPKFLNPETLFRKKHWDTYLNQTPQDFEEHDDDWKRRFLSGDG